MRALVKREGGVRLEERPTPAIDGPHAVRIRVAFAGICRTDLYVADGLRRARSNVILGHELSGVIDAVGSAVKLPVGSRVTVAPELACGDCAGCVLGAPCAGPRMLGIQHDGAFADHLVVPEGAVVLLPPELPLERAAYVEPVAAALAVLELPELGPEQRGLVLGTNRIAELLHRLFALRNWRVDREPEAKGTSYAFVVETLATADTLARCLELVRHGGVVVLKSRPEVPVALDIARAVQKCLTLRAANYGSFPAAVQLLASGALAVSDLLAPPVDLEQWEQAFEAARAPGASKILFRLCPPASR